MSQKQRMMLKGLRLSKLQKLNDQNRQFQLISEYWLAYTRGLKYQIEDALTSFGELVIDTIYFGKVRALNQGKD